jgi:hypothetical protein
MDLTHSQSFEGFIGPDTMNIVTDNGVTLCGKPDNTSIDYTRFQVN